MLVLPRACKTAFELHECMLPGTILDSIHVAGETLSIKYSSQPQLFCRCGDSSHFANDCKQPRCYNCDLPGHRAMECDQSVLCGICFKLTHPLVECPFVCFSTNVELSYVEKVREDPTLRTPRSERTSEQREAMRVASEAAKQKEAESETA